MISHECVYATVIHIAYNYTHMKPCHTELYTYMPQCHFNIHSYRVRYTTYIDKNNHGNSVLFMHEHQ